MVTNIEAIWQEYHDKLRGFIQSRVGDKSTADDILQDVFLRIHSRINTLKETSKIKSWVYQITRNAVIDYYRVNKPMEELPELLATPGTDASVKAGEVVTGCVLSMIKRLPEHYRQALMLSEIEGLTQKEVAKRQGISLSGSKSRIQRGRSMVKDMLKEVCHLEFDHQGNLIDARSKGAGCDNC
jgi:RNA polymerase sigma-70 factor (ECF subfamily)